MMDRAAFPRISAARRPALLRPDPRSRGDGIWTAWTASGSMGLMELVGFLIASAASQAVRSLVSGKAPASSELATFASGSVDKLLAGMLQAQDDTARTLARMERDIKELKGHPYTTRINMGYQMLQEAAPIHRDPADRRRFLDAALTTFIEASAVAPNSGITHEAVAQTHLLIATCWLAKGSGRDFDAALQSAAERALVGIGEVNARVYHPSSDRLASQRPGLLRSVAREFGLAEPSPRERNQATLNTYHDAVKSRHSLVDLFNGIQQVRRAFGIEAFASPRLIGFKFDNEVLGPHEDPDFERFKRLSFGRPLPTPQPVLELPARVAGLTLRVLDAAISLRMRSSENVANLSLMVDAAIEVEAPSPLTAAAGWPDDFIRRSLAHQAAEAFADESARAPYLPQQQGLVVWDGERPRDLAQHQRLALRCWTTDGAPSQLAFEYAPTLAGAARPATVGDRKYLYFVHALE
jgi:hypothetical protein